MKKEIRSILDDLYRLDGNFKQNEKELIALIEKLLSVKPDIEINEEFAKSLREQIMRKAGLSEIETVKSDYFGALKRLFFPFAGGIVTTVLVVGLIYYGNMKSAVIPSLNQDVTVLKDEAFGRISNIVEDSVPAAVQNYGGEAVSGHSDVLNAESGAFASDEANYKINSQTSPLKDNIAVKNISARPEDAPRATGMGGAGVTSPAVSAKMMPPYNPQVYKYVYKGEPVELKDEQVMVYRRKNVSANDSAIVNVAKTFGFGAIDLSGFDDLSVQNINLAQNVKNGYAINIDLYNQTVGIYQNWSYWEQPYDMCKGDEKCIEKLQIKPKNIPSDEKITAISDTFFKEHRVDISSYGDPVVLRYWENNDPSADVSQIYVGEEISVVYPLKINGMTAVGEGGDPYGLNVNVNIRVKKVSNVSNLRINDFESSQYSAVTDFADITKYYEGLQNYGYSDDEKAKITDIELGNPEKVIEVLNRPDKDNQSVYTEYFVPALRFPINRKPGAWVYQKNLIVPLAKDMLTQSEPVAVPLMRSEGAMIK